MPSATSRCVSAHPQSAHGPSEHDTTCLWPDGTQYSRNIYARTREECEEKLKALIAEMNEERKNLKEQLAGIAPPEKLTKKQRKLWDYMRLHPEVTEFSTLAKRTGLARNTVKKHYGMVTAMLGRK